MAKRIYTENNYILVDNDNGNVEEIPMQGSFYNESTQSVSIVNPNASINVPILVSDVANWYDEAGTTPYSLATLKTFLRTNTGFNPASGGSGAYDFEKFTVNLGEFEVSSLGTAKEVLPFAGVGKYWDVDRYTIQTFVNGSTPYQLGTGDFIYIGFELSAIYKGIDRTALTAGISQIITDSFTGKYNATDDVDKQVGQRVNDRVVIGTWNGGNPNFGDGDMVINIWAKLRNLGE